MNSNWKGLPDTLSEERIEFQIIVNLKPKTGGLSNTANTAHYITEYQGQPWTVSLMNLHPYTVSKLQILQERRLLAESGRILRKLITLLDLVEKKKAS
ncbi:MAG: hypothetical protein ACLUSV_08660 [Streptococcus sp.]